MWTAEAAIHRSLAWTGSWNVRGLHGDDHRYAHVAIPVRLLMGTETPPHHVDAIRRLKRQLPNSRTVVLEGHGHSAHLTAPELVAAAVIELNRTRRAIDLHEGDDVDPTAFKALVRRAAELNESHQK